MNIHNPAEEAPESLEEALSKARSNDVASPNRMNRVQAALAFYSRATGRPLNELPAHRGHVIQRFRQFRRRGVCVSSKTLSNYRSEICWLIGKTGGRGPRSHIALGHEWLAVKAILSGKYDWCFLTRFSGFCSSNGVTPGAVSDADVERFMDNELALGELEDPHGYGRRVVATWNKIAGQHPELNLPRLTAIPGKTRRWTLPEEAFTASLQKDVKAWLAFSASDDPFAEKPRRQLKPSTIRHTRHLIFKAASALVYSGRDAESINSLADLVTVDGFEALMRFLLMRQGGAKTEALLNVARKLLAIARHHVRVDAATEDRLATIVANLDCRQPGLSNRTRRRLKAVEDRRVRDAIIRLPQSLLRQAKVARSPRKRRLLAQLAIACEILLVAPLRIGNLSNLRIGGSFTRVTSDKDANWLITFEPHEVKNRAHLLYELPEESTRHIDQALRLYDQPGGWLFPGCNGSHKTNLSWQIKKAVESNIGIEWHTHMFRAFVAYLVLSDNPANFEVVLKLLGNSDAGVVRESYAFLAEKPLIASGQAAVLKSRRHLGVEAPRASRRREG